MRLWPLALSSLVAACAPAPAPAPALASAPASAPEPALASAPAPASALAHEAAALLDAWHAAAARADEAAYFDAFAEGGIFMGTDATERWDVPAFRAYAHPRFAKGKAWTFRAARRAVRVRGDVVWFDEDLETERLGPARGSGVLTREGGKLKIAQYILSIPIPNERFAAVRRAINPEGDDAGPGPSSK